MKRIWKMSSVLLSACLGLGVCACGGDNSQGNGANKEGAFNPVPETLKVLAIGNSFSDDTMEYVGKIAQSLGVKEIKLGNLYIGGCSIERHYWNAASDSAAYEYRVNDDGQWHTTPAYKISDAVKSEDWQYITFQQASGSSGMEETYEKLGDLLALVRGWASENTKFAWNMTWAYQQDSTHNEFYKYNNDQTTMYEAITSTVQKLILPRKDISLVIPTGTAIQNARTSVLGDTLTRDGFHLSIPCGRYVAGLTLFAAITGADVRDISYYPGAYVAEEIKKAAVEAAVNAVKTPFAVTKSTVTSKA